MKLVRRQEPDQKPVVLDSYGAVYWHNTELGKHIINNLAAYFTKGNDVPGQGVRFTAVAKDGMLYYNDTAEELKEIIYKLDRWILQEQLNNLIDYGD
jgi:hypothetical protein